MKFMAIVSMLVACATAQVAYNPYGYAGYLPYAANYGYNAYSAGRTALDVFPVNKLYNAYSAFNLPYAYNYAGYAPAATLATAATPVASSVAAIADPAATPATVFKAGEIDAAVIDTADPAEAAPERFPIRQIFPVFDTDLRGGGTTVNFARPSEVIAIQPDLSGDDFVVITPETRSFRVASSAINLPVAPAGIIQAEQPRFYSFNPFGQAVLRV